MEDTYRTSNSDVVVIVSKDSRGELVQIEVYDIDSVLGIGPDFEYSEGLAPLWEYAGCLSPALHHERCDFLRTKLADVKRANFQYEKDGILSSIAAVVMAKSEDEEDEPL